MIRNIQINSDNHNFSLVTVFYKDGGKLSVSVPSCHGPMTPERVLDALQDRLKFSLVDASEFYHMLSDSLA